MLKVKENHASQVLILETALEFYAKRLHQDPDTRSLKRNESCFKSIEWVENGLIAFNALKDYRKLKAKG